MTQLAMIEVHAAAWLEAKGVRMRIEERGGEGRGVRLQENFDTRHGPGFHGGRAAFSSPDAAASPGSLFPRNPSEELVETCGFDSDRRMRKRERESPEALPFASSIPAEAGQSRLP